MILSPLHTLFRFFTFLASCRCKYTMMFGIPGGENDIRGHTGMTYMLAGRMHLTELRIVPCLSLYLASESTESYLLVQASTMNIKRFPCFRFFALPPSYSISQVQQSPTCPSSTSSETVTQSPWEIMWNSSGGPRKRPSALFLPNPASSFVT